MQENSVHFKYWKPKDVLLFSWWVTGIFIWFFPISKKIGWSGDGKWNIFWVQWNRPTFSFSLNNMSQGINLFSPHIFTLLYFSFYWLFCRKADNLQRGLECKAGMTLLDLIMLRQWTIVHSLCRTPYMLCFFLTQPSLPYNVREF